MLIATESQSSEPFITPVGVSNREMGDFPPSETAVRLLEPGG